MSGLYEKLAGYRNDCGQLLIDPDLQMPVAALIQALPKIPTKDDLALARHLFSQCTVGDVVHFDHTVRLRGSVKVSGFTSGRAITPSADDVAVLLMSMSGATEQAYRKAFDRLIKMTPDQKKAFRASEHGRFAAIKAIKQSAPKAAGSVRLSVAAELEGGAE